LDFVAALALLVLELLATGVLGGDFSALHALDCAVGTGIARVLFLALLLQASNRVLSGIFRGLGHEAPVPFGPLVFLGRILFLFLFLNFLFFLRSWWGRRRGHLQVHELPIVGREVLREPIDLGIAEGDDIASADGLDVEFIAETEEETVAG